MFHIEADDFEKKRHIFEMWHWINAKLDELEATPNFDEEYFLQGDRIVKKLIEEAIPIARFCLSLVRQKQDVFIKCLAGNQPFDAELCVAGHDSYDLRLEVTTTQTPETVSARHRLGNAGFTYRPAKIKVNGKWVDLERPIMVDVGEQIDEWTATAFERAGKKVTSGKYDPETAILVSVDTWKLIPIHDRAALVARTRRELAAHLPNVHDVYYVYSYGEGIDSVKRNKY